LRTGRFDVVEQTGAKDEKLDEERAA
jgi:hypothetical protein